MIININNKNGKINKYVGFYNKRKALILIRIEK